MQPSSDSPRRLADVIAQAGEPLVLDFWAQWCSPCASYAPVVEEVMAERGDRATLVRVNLVDDPALAADCAVSTIPALVVVRKGEVRRRIFGARPRAQLAEEIDRALA